MVQALNDAQFNELTSEGLVVIDFWAPWCGPCRMQGPIIDELSEELEGQVTFYKLNVDEQQQTASQFGIMSIPTMLIKKDNEIVETLVGLHDKSSLTTILDKYIA